MWPLPLRITKGQNFKLFWKVHMRLYNDLLLIRTLYLVLCARYSASKVSGSNLDLSGSPKVKYFTFYRKPICDFIMALCWYEISILYCARYSASKISISDLDLLGSPKVKYLNFFAKPIWDFIMVFYWYELSISHRLPDIPHLRFRSLTLTFQGHLRSNISASLESLYTTL